MQWAGEASRQRYADVVAHAHGALIGLDYDGTLAPIVSDPRDAAIHPEMPALLAELCQIAQAVAIVTGRPARQAVALGALDDIADACPNLMVVGQYGNEMWSSADRRVLSPPPPHGIAGLLSDLPALFRRLQLDPWVEEKGIAVAVHTRRLADPAEAFRRLLPELRDLAERHDLTLEPGRFVIEARARGMDKGIALRKLVSTLSPAAVMFAGDDLGDLQAFAEVDALRAEGLPALQVCSGSPEEHRLAEEADVILDGPEGVAAFFRQFLDDVQIGL
ncbi:MAG: trehalose-phosphatase [Marmoricola sp.]